MTQKTRSQRHQKQATPRRPLTMALPLAGAAMMVTPMVVDVSQQVSADEVGYSQAQQLINQIGPSASQIADQYDLYASVMIAQALLESGNGGSTLSSAPYYNLFGVKEYHGGPSVWLSTQEYLNGQWVTMSEPFRQYNSYYESLVDHANVLVSQGAMTGQPRYAGSFKRNAPSYYEATAALTGRYATDPTYGQKLNWLIQNYQLTQYDTGSSYVEATPVVEETATQSAQAAVQTTSGTTYTVVEGDSLWSIAQKYNVSLDDLIAKNNISGNLIVVGQQLTL
ncbi:MULTISPECIES: glucosaminidase domain-containing protein [Enterococcus]|uniref:Peptidoglycan hydrolase n=1 Tax=Enterococcus sulfureus ATCC 49903 TaxID=1140003 RepID=S0KSR9_9ENTE|nr:glucosaminidase domain-containing protein [Enterococcus sulfureus]EOT47692.1 hypothetical protein OMY_01066 [Enterococcus sulfureus ATCC 49903]EOT83887.1 hypothetical protein I573_01612 [Enterococcus sulfureus ATCC 49903]